VASLARELDELTFGGKTEEEVAHLKKTKHEMDKKLKEQVSVRLSFFFKACQKSYMRSFCVQAAEIAKSRYNFFNQLLPNNFLIFIMYSTL
jgi:hypothetical protein